MKVYESNIPWLSSLTTHLIDRHLKKLPFSLHTLTAMRGFQPRTASGGIVYVNGAARSGAVAKILQEVRICR